MNPIHFKKIWHDKFKYAIRFFFSRSVLTELHIPDLKDIETFNNEHANFSEVKINVI